MALGVLLGGLLSLLAAFPVGAVVNPVDQYPSFGGNYARDRFSTYFTAPNSDGTVDSSVYGLQNFLKLPMGGSGNPVVFWDGQDSTIYLNGYAPVPGHPGQYQVEIWGLSYDALKSVVTSGSDNYGLALLWGGQPIVLPMTLNAVQARGVAGLSISPDGQWMSMGEADELFAWHRSDNPAPGCPV